MIAVQALGAAEIRIGPHRVVPTAHRAFSLLLYLAAERGRRIAPVMLAELIFPRQPGVKAAHSLRQLVHRLRGDGAPIETEKNGYAVPADQARSDYGEAIDAGALTPEEQSALEQGFLTGYLPEGSGPFAEWLDGHRSGVTRDLRNILARQIADAKTRVEWPAAHRAARALFALDPLSEAANFCIAEYLVVQGSKAEGVDVLDHYLAELGPERADVRAQATSLRRRIRERLPVTPYQARREAPFVGREAEQRVMLDRYRRARAGEAQCTLLHGDEGIGKSRLAAEFSLLASLEGARVVPVTTQPHEVNRPLAAFIDAVPLMLDLPGALGCSPESMAALKRLTTFQLGQSRRREAESREQTEASLYEVTRAINDLVDAIAAESPIVFLIEDAQWLDPTSLRVISGLISQRVSRRLLVVLTSRDAAILSVAPSNAERLTLVPVVRLTAAETSELVSKSLGPTPGLVSDDLRRWMEEKSAGNPFFVKLIALHHIETGERFGIPSTLKELVVQRLATLSARAVSVFLSCVALGKYCTIDLLRSALELPHTDLVEAIAELERRQLLSLVDDRAAPSHGLFADLAMTDASPVTRRLVQHAIAELLEREAAGSASAAQLWDAAELWLAAGNRQRALALLRECATHSLELGRAREAAMSLLRAAEAADGNPRKLDFLSDAVLAADHGGETAIVLTAAEQIRRIRAHAEHDDVELAEAAALIYDGHATESLRQQLGQCIHDQATSAEHRIRACELLFVAAIDFNDRAGADSTCLTLVALGDTCSDRRKWLESLLVYHMLFGDLDKAASVAKELIVIAYSIRPAESVALLRRAGLALHISGSLEEALEVFEQAYERAKTAGLIQAQLNVAVILAEACLNDPGRAQQSEGYWLQAEQLVDEHPEYASSPTYLTGRVSHALWHSEFQVAKELVAAAKEQWVSAKSTRPAALIRGYELRIKNAFDDPPLLESELREAMDMAAVSDIHSGISDTAMVVVCECLIERGRSADSERLLKDYISRRRTRNRLDIHLQRIRQAFAAQDSVRAAPTQTYCG